jgi:hypothetical protein
MKVLYIHERFGAPGGVEALEYNCNLFFGWSMTTFLAQAEFT